MEKHEANKVLQRVIREAKTLNIPVSRKIRQEIRFNSRPKKRYGCCHRVDGEYIIEISDFILAGEDKAIAGVIAHEVLHTCRDSCNHGDVWKANAAKMNAAYGYNIKRTTSYEEIGLTDSDEGNEIKAKYIIRCKQCGREYPRQRYTCVMKKINAYRCGCGGKLEVLSATR